MAISVVGGKKRSSKKGGRKSHRSQKMSVGGNCGAVGGKRKVSKGKRKSKSKSKSKSRK